MNKRKKHQWLCGLAALAVIAVFAVAWMIGEAVRKREAKFWVSRYERTVPIYGAEEGEDVLLLLQEQADRNRMDAAEENKNICVYYSLTGKIVHKEVFDHFLSNVEKKTEDAVILMESDWEGRVNIHYISYRESEFFYVLDSGGHYDHEEPLMRSFKYGDVYKNSICLSVTRNKEELDAWDDAWIREAEEMSKAFTNQEISGEEYRAWQAERRERSKERPCIWVRVSEESFM